MTCVLCATQPLRGAIPCEPEPGNDFDRQIVGTPLPNIARHLVLRYSLRNCDRYLDLGLTCESVSAPGSMPPASCPVHATDAGGPLVCPRDRAFGSAASSGVGRLY